MVQTIISKRFSLSAVLSVIIDHPYIIEPQEYLDVFNFVYGSSRAYIPDITDNEWNVVFNRIISQYPEMVKIRERDEWKRFNDMKWKAPDECKRLGFIDWLEYWRDIYGDYLVLVRR
jgi:hypothetical protein